MRLSTEMKWLQSWIKARLTLDSTKTFKEILAICPPPYTVEENTESKGILSDYNLSEEEKLVVLLSLAPYMMPWFLVSIFKEKQNGQNDMNTLPAFYDKARPSVIPTYETAVFLLGGSNIDERIKYLSMFGAKSFFFSYSLLSFPENIGNAPFTQALLAPGSTTLNVIFKKSTDEPEFSHDFPASLLDADLEWDELILDSDTKKHLEEIKEWLEYEEMIKSDQDIKKMFKAGYRCLFHGIPGTGKTLAASLIGKYTDRKVYRVDLSMVVSKYIGETEKNLAKIFDRADHGKWILFFDEADALFGKRGQTNSAHDRYANQEVSYLLQRFEAYSGVSILATNFKENIDKAFNRRFHNIVNFKFPEPNERKQLWEVYLPKEFNFASDIDLVKVSESIKMNGAAIHNVMRRSVMKAVLRGSTTIEGADIYASVKIEFAKENKMI